MLMNAPACLPTTVMLMLLALTQLEVLSVTVITVILEVELIAVSSSIIIQVEIFQYFCMFA